MPAFIAAAIFAGVAGGFVGGAFVAFAWGTFAAALVIGGISYAMSRSSQKKLSNFDMGLGQRDERISIRQEIGPHQIVYGRRRVGGTIVQIESTSSNTLLHLVIVLAGHECDAVEQIYFNDAPLTLDGNGVVTTPPQYAGQATIKVHLGAAAQTADATYVAASGGKWTSDHRLRGRTYLYVLLNGDVAAFPSGAPNISAVLRGKKVYDPRSTLTVWSANSALCLLDYMTDTTYGLGLNYAARIDAGAVIGAANICDETVGLDIGGTEKRYETNGSFDAEIDPKTALEQLTNAMAGRVARIGGRWRIHAGAYWTPTETLTTDDFRGAISIRTLLSGREAFNGVRGTFTSPSNNWVPDDFPPVQVAAYVTEDQGVETWAEVELPFTTSVTMAQRLAKIHLERARRQITITVPCKLPVMRIQPPETVMITESRYGWSSKVFEVVGFNFAVDRDDEENPYLGVDLTLREMDSGVFSWSSAEEGTYNAGASTTLPDPFSVATPSGLALFTGDAYALTSTDGTVVPRIYLTWTAHPDMFVVVGGRIEIQYKPESESNWHDAAPVPGDATSTYISGISSGTDYDVRIRAVNQIGSRSAWTSGNIAATGKSSGPNAPTNLVATPIVEGIRLTWTSPTNADLSYIEVWRHTSNIRSAATRIAVVDGTTYDDTPLVALDVRYYWVRGVNTSKVAGAWSNGENAGATAAAGFATLDPGAIDIDALAELWLPNLVQNPNFLSGTLDGHTIVDIDVPAIGGGVNQSTTWKLVGEGTAYMTDDSTGGYAGTDVGYAAITRTNLEEIAGYFQVTEGKKYQAHALMLPILSTGRVQIRWLNSAGALISTSQGNAVSASASPDGQTLDKYGQSVVFATAPTDARYAAVRVVKTGNTAGGGALYWTREFFSVAGDSQTIPSEWSSTGLLIDGGVVKAGTFSGQKIIVETVTGDKLAANTVTANKMSVTNLQAISAQMGTLAGGTIDVAYGPTGADTGYLRSTGKAWADSSAGWVLARHPTNGTYLEFYGNANTYIRIGQGSAIGAPGGYGEIRFPKFYVDHNGNGTFSGALSAATGTFSGSLTADAVNAISTINLRGQSITIPASTLFGYNPWFSCGPVGAPTLVASLPFVSEGYPIFIWMTFSIITQSNEVTWQLLVDSTVIQQGTVYSTYPTPGVVSLSWRYDVLPGAHTFWIQVWNNTVGWVTMPIGPGSMLLLETKR